MFPLHFYLPLHAILRWLVLLSLVYALFRAWRGYSARLGFTRADNRIRHWTATIAHIQMMVGMILYSQSPIIRYFWKNFDEAIGQAEFSFFGLVHGLVMLLAVGLITAGSALAKRTEADREKFKKMLVWYGVALGLILLAIPWPFSPLAARPFIRLF